MHLCVDFHVGPSNEYLIFSCLSFRHFFLTDKTRKYSYDTEMAADGYQTRKALILSEPSSSDPRVTGVSYFTHWNDPYWGIPLLKRVMFHGCIFHVSRGSCRSYVKMAAANS